MRVKGAFIITRCLTESELQSNTIHNSQPVFAQVSGALRTAKWRAARVPSGCRPAFRRSLRDLDERGAGSPRLEPWAIVVCPSGTWRAWCADEFLARETVQTVSLSSAPRSTQLKLGVNESRLAEGVRRI